MEGYREVTVNRGGTQFQKQTTFNQTWLPLIQAGMALGVAALTVLDIMAFMWLVGPLLSAIIFWIPAAFFAWKRNVLPVVLCVGLALFVFVALALGWTFPYFEVDEWWWPWARVMLAVVTVALPAVAYPLFKRYVTDLRFENLLSSVMVQRGRLREGLISDTIGPVPDEKNDEAFRYS